MVFKHFKYSAYEKNTISHNNITSFAEDKDGSFWLGTDGGGLNYYDKKSGKFSNYKDLTTNPKSSCRSKRQEWWTLVGHVGRRIKLL
jgi:ligand-binding sensor domain-containing protein